MAQKRKFSLRCSLCNTNWPYNQDLYNPCPECDDMTFPSRDRPDMSDADAASRKSAADFEKFYAEWDASNDPERLLPTADDDVRYPFVPKRAIEAQ